jgi:hypothetical protein
MVINYIMAINTKLFVSPNDLNTLFDKYRSGTKNATTGFIVNGTDICDLFQKYSSGTKQTLTGFKISNGTSDLSDIFQKYGTYVMTSNYMGNGVFSVDVRAIRIHSSTGNVIIGGGFTQYGTNTGTGTGALNRVAVWNGSTLSPLGTKILNGAVGAIEIDGNDIYIAGNFTLLGTATAQRIVKYNISSDIWTILSTTFNSYIYSIGIDKVNNRIYVAGGNSAGRVSYATIGSNTWTAIAPGTTFNNNSTGLTVNPTNGYVYICGAFTNTPYTNRIAVFDGTTLSALSNTNMVTTALSIVKYYNNKLYIGGTISTADGNTCNNICYYDFSDDTYHTMGNGFNNTVNAIHISDTGEIYAGGLFTASGTDTTVKYIAKWNESTNTWNSFVSLNNSISTNAIITNTNYVYFGGTFTTFNSNTNAGGLSYYG